MLFDNKNNRGYSYKLSVFFILSLPNSKGMFEIRCSLPLNSSKSSFKNITGLRLSRELSVLKVKTDMLVKGMDMLKEMMYKLQNQPAIAEVYKQCTLCQSIGHD